MKLFRHSSPPWSLKWQQPREADGVGAAGGVEEVVEEAAVVVVSPTSPIKTKVRVRIKPERGQAPSTLIFRQESGPDVICISAGGKELSSVQSRRPAPGRIFTPKSLQNNERLTNSAKVTTISKIFKIYCMTKT